MGFNFDNTFIEDLLKSLGNLSNHNFRILLMFYFSCLNNVGAAAASALRENRIKDTVARRYRITWIIIVHNCSSKRELAVHEFRDMAGLHTNLNNLALY